MFMFPPVYIYQKAAKKSRAKIILGKVKMMTHLQEGFKRMKNSIAPVWLRSAGGQVPSPKNYSKNLKVI